MTAAQFSDDAYNRRLTGGGAGTLIGNWAEERAIRDATGEGRAVPQRHLKRSGLLKDFTKTPTDGPRKMDNTFERVYGPRSDEYHVTAASTIGNFGDTANVNHVGPKESILRQLRNEHAAADVEQEEAEVRQGDNERFFHTNYSLSHQKPDESKVERPQFLRKSCKQELRHGIAPDRDLALDNRGLEVPAIEHYSNTAEPTHHRMALDHPQMRNDMRVSAVGGVHAFGKNSEFSKPVGEFKNGLWKDETLDQMYTNLQSTQPLRTMGGSEPRAGAFSSVPSLATLKQQIQDCIARSLGVHGYVTLRQSLFDSADMEGSIKKGIVINTFRELLDLNAVEASDMVLECYLEQLSTMKSDQVRVGALMTSLRPGLPQQSRRRVLEAFRTLGPQDGAVRLGDWMARVEDPQLRATITRAFGFEDETQILNMGLTESMFVELLSDLAPLMDIDPLL